MTETTATTTELYGLVVDADLALPAGHPASAGAGADLVVRGAGTRPVSDEPPSGRLLGELVHRGIRYHTVAERDDGTVLLRVHRVADFEVAPGGHLVRWWRDPRTTDDHVALLVSAAVPALVLALADRCVVHASAVEVDGAAVAFAGMSGMGKSTLAGLFCAAGAALVTDDVLHVGVDGPPAVVGGCRELRLRPSAAWLLELFDEPPPVRSTADDRLAITPASAGRGDRPLRAVVIPRPDRTATEPSVARVPPPLAAVQLLRFARSNIDADRARHRRRFDLAAAVAAEVPLWVATVPWGAPCGPDVPAKLCASLGLAFP